MGTRLAELYGRPVEWFVNPNSPVYAFAVIMTAAAIIVGLLPILYGSGAGSEVMSRIAAPMAGGMLSAVLLTLLVLPAVYYLSKQRTKFTSHSRPSASGA